MHISLYVCLFYALYNRCCFKNQQTLLDPSPPECAKFLRALTDKKRKIILSTSTHACMLCSWSFHICSHQHQDRATIGSMMRMTLRLENNTLRWQLPVWLINYSQIPTLPIWISMYAITGKPWLSPCSQSQIISTNTAWQNWRAPHNQNTQDCTRDRFGYLTEFVLAVGIKWSAVEYYHPF